MKKSALNFVNKEWVLIIVIILSISLHQPIETFLTGFIVSPVLKYIESEWYNDFFIILISLYIFLYTFRRRRKYHPSKQFTKYLTIVSLFYLYYRFSDKVWTFTDFSWILMSYLKYADIILIATISHIYLYCASQKKRDLKTQDKKGFFEDKPIVKIDDDVLGFGDYANQLSKKILDSSFKNSFALGINGKWGSGKSSMLNLVKNNMKDKDSIEVVFNPWASNSPDSIIEDFFLALQRALTPYHSSLSRMLKSYSNRVINDNSGVVNKVTSALSFFIEGSNSTGELMIEINKSLKEIGKKLVIYIDDLDRLGQYEIIEVLRLIRNTASFHNTVYIVTYDRSYIISALHNFNSHNNEFFLEKIFQLEVSLPIFTKDVLREELVVKLISRLPEEKDKVNLHDVIKKEVIGDISNNPVFLDDWLENMRDVTRLANSIMLNFQDLIGEVNFNDLLRIELLRVKYPKVYELIAMDTYDFFVTGPSIHDMEAEYKMDLLLISRVKDERNIKIETKFETYFEYYTNEYYKELSIPHFDLIKVNKFVAGIFSEGEIQFVNREKLSIVHPSKFNRYFAYRLLSGSLSEVEFSNARDLDQNDFNSNISKWLGEGKVIELRRQFYDINTFDSKEDFEKIIRAIFYFANWKKDSASQTIGFEYQKIYDKLSLLVCSKYYKSEGDLKRFVRDIFKSAKSPYLFESNVLRYLVNLPGVHDDLPLSDKEFNDINIDYLENYTSNTSKFDSNIGALFYNCKMMSWIDTGVDDGATPFPYPPEAVKIIKEFIFEKDLEGFINTLVYSDSIDSDKYKISTLGYEIFGGLSELKRELSDFSKGDNPIIEEFLEFLLRLSLVDYKYGISFPFKNIEVNVIMK